MNHYSRSAKACTQPIPPYQCRESIVCFCSAGGLELQAFFHSLQYHTNTKLFYSARPADQGLLDPLDSTLDPLPEKGALRVGEALHMRQRCDLQH
jgi:hypothetical protein